MTDKITDKVTKGANAMTKPTIDCDEVFEARKYLYDLVPIEYRQYVFTTLAGDFAYALATAIRDHLMAMQWQPIETAPKDERVILGNPHWPISAEGGWHEGKEPKHDFAHYTGNPSYGAHLPMCDYWGYGSDNCLPFNKRYQPTHWMPLPQPPAAREAQGE